MVAISATLVVATLQAFLFFQSFALVAYGSLASRTLLNESQAKVIELETHLKDQAWLGLISPCVIDPSHVKLRGVGQSGSVVVLLLSLPQI